MTERDLDVVVLGATGVTGRRVAAYLAERAPATGARWAAAGRDAAKLGRVLAETGVQAPETVVADVDDPASLAEMAARARVVLNLVGPYTRYGEPVIRACVEAGAHYADLTGEIPFVRRIIDAYDARATESGTKIVQVCGFEALPPDLAVALAAQTARSRWDEGLADVDVQVSWTLPPGPPRPSDAISGGTFQSLAAMASDDPDVARAADPAALVTDAVTADEVRRRSPIQVRPRRIGADVVGPMAPAAFINPAVIHRSAMLRAAAEGRPGAEPFVYHEGVRLAGSRATLPLRYAAAATLSGVQGALLHTTRMSPALRGRLGGVLAAALPASGYGPAPDRLQAWRWRLAVDARTDGGAHLRIDVDAEGHPGYLATARMLGEAGLMLAEPGTTPDLTGCLTPSTALGVDNAKRFAHARVWFRADA